jgi:uncharacterized protein
MNRHDHDHTSSQSGGGCCDARPKSVAATAHGGSSAQAPGCHETPAPVKPAGGCWAPAAPVATPSCCPSDVATKRPDWFLWGSITLVALGYGLYLFGPSTLPHWLHHYAEGSFELMNAMWWGIALGIFFVGLLGHVPRETIMRLLGRGGTFPGLLRATGAGVLLDLCSHGILAVGMKLYERGASVGQMMAFLIASPWNSFSLTLILFALIGVGWTLAFILLSLVIALISGWIFDRLVAAGKLPDNPNRLPADADLSAAPGLMALIRAAKPSGAGMGRLLMDGLRGSKMVIRWAMFGVVLASLIRAFVPAEVFADWFGPTMLGLAMTLVAATIIEVCSEGSVPIAADLMGRAGAPGNSFTFLMAGIATDYTEIMVIRDTTRSWKLALMLPVVTVPQVVLIGALLNLAA